MGWHVLSPSYSILSVLELLNSSVISHWASWTSRLVPLPLVQRQLWLWLWSSPTDVLDYQISSLKSSNRAFSPSCILTSFIPSKMWTQIPSESKTWAPKSRRDCLEMLTCVRGLWLNESVLRYGERICLSSLFCKSGRKSDLKVIDWQWGKAEVKWSEHPSLHQFPFSAWLCTKKHNGQK